MKTIFIFLVAFIVNSSTVLAADVNYGQVKKRLLNRDVRIGGEYIYLPGNQKHNLADWKLVGRSPDGTAKISLFEYVAESERNSIGKVIAVELVNKPSSNVDAFGKEIDILNIKDPYVEVIVLLEDGKEIAVRGYDSSFGHKVFEFVEEAEIARKDIDIVIAKIIGTKVYLPAYAKVFEASVLIDDLMRGKSKNNTMSISEVPRGTALKIIDAKYLDGFHKAIIKIEFPNGNHGIIIGDTQSYYLKRNYKPTELDRLGFYAEQSLPKQFTTREVSSIKKTEIFIGMSKQALEWSIGLEQKVNDYGKAGLQLIFETGLIVYLKNDRVTDFQRF